MLQHPTLPALLAGHTLVIGRRRCARRPLQAVLVWGQKPSGHWGEQLAKRRGLPLWRCEDAFLRSLGLGPDSPPLGLLLDDTGTYYDAGRPSRLEATAAKKDGHVVATWIGGRCMPMTSGTIDLG
jgi:capsular polysaccharide export protein